MEDYIAHYGIKRKSGRYPWGSGKRPYQSGGGPSGSKAVAKPIPKDYDEPKMGIDQGFYSQREIDTISDIIYDTVDKHKGKDKRGMMVLDAAKLVAEKYKDDGIEKIRHELGLLDWMYQGNKYLYDLGNDSYWQENDPDSKEGDSLDDFIYGKSDEWIKKYGPKGVGVQHSAFSGPYLAHYAVKRCHRK